PAVDSASATSSAAPVETNLPKETIATTESGANIASEKVAKAPATAAETSVTPTGLTKNSEEDRLEAARKMEERAKRFNIPVPEEARKLQRAARFGLPLEAKPTVSAAGGKKEIQQGGRKGEPNGKKAAIPSASPSLGVSSEKLSKRAERFGIAKTPADNATGSKSSSTSTSNKRARMEASPVDEAEAERRRKRAERFGTAPSSTPTAPSN
ncbi:hypothetical protein BJ684DRAFT_17398, partial [Piptocephalis cylindrospora]